MMDCRVFAQADRDRKLRADIPPPMYAKSIGIKKVLAIPRYGILRMSVTLLMVVALTACQQTAPTKSAYSPEETIDQAAGVDQSRVMEELSARSRIPTSELRGLLDDCSRTQLAMTLCALRNLIAVDLELEARREAAPAQCRAELDSAHAAWEAERDRTCHEETEEDKGGSMYPMLLSFCKAEAGKARIMLMREMDPCAGER